MSEMTKRKTKLTAKTAKAIIRDGSVKGHKLTKKQKKFFGTVAERGAKPKK